MDPRDERCRDEEGGGVDGEEHAQRHEEEKGRSQCPAADVDGVGTGPDERIRLLDVRAAHECGEERAVRRIEIARRGGEKESRQHESPEREIAGEPRDRNRDQDRSAEEVGRDHRPPPLEPVGEEAAVQAEKKRRDAVGEPDDEHACRARDLEGEPHERDVLERVAELAGRDRRVRQAEVPPAKEVEGALGRLPMRVWERFLGLGGQYIGQNCLQAVHQSSAFETRRRPSTISMPWRKR